MSEESARKTIKAHVQALEGFVNWQRFEDKLAAGIPDIYISWSDFPSRTLWVEAKYLDEDKLPKRTATPVRVGLRPEQAAWLHLESRVTECRVVVRIGRRGWMVFDDGWFQLRDGLPWAALVAKAACAWDGPFNAAAMFDPRSFNKLPQRFRTVG